MEITINNRSIFFAVENCWDKLSYKLKYQLNELVTTNSVDDFVQTVNIDKESFLLIMRAVNSQPQGIAKEINPIMYDSLKTQILEKAQKGDTEAIEILKEMQDILVENATMLENKIINGKSQILAE
jgi:N-acetylglucosamine kinase-like BadF-type ATPase